MVCPYYFCPLQFCACQAPKSTCQENWDSVWGVVAFGQTLGLTVRWVILTSPHQSVSNHVLMCRRWVSAALKCICKSSEEFLNLIFQVCQMWTRPNLNFSPKRRPGCGFMSMQSNAFRVGSEIFWDFDTLLIYMSSPGISLSLNVRGRAIELHS